MSDILSQEEIDALLRSHGQQNSSKDIETILSDIEKDALGEIGNISMGTAATTLSMLLRNKVVITTPKVTVTTMTELGKEYPIPFVAVEVKYTQGLEGVNLLILKQDDVKLITDLMMGGDGSNISDELGELHLSAIGEAMNQMVGSAATSLSTMFNKDINISPPKAFVIDFANETPYDAFSSEEPLVRIAFTMEIGKLLKSEMMQLLPIDFAKELVSNLLGNNQPLQNDTAAQPMARKIEPDQTIQLEAGGLSEPEQKSDKVVKAQPVVFQQLSEEPIKTNKNTNMDLIMDVPLQVTVELGRTKKLVREILELGPGSVLELDRLAGEPIDIIVNGKLIAKGEVIVIDENFGVRIIEMINQNTAKNLR